MASDYAPNDITKGNTPDLAELAEEVRRTNQPRTLRRADEDIAVIAPVTKVPAQRAKRRPTADDVAAFEAAFGGWKDVDTDRFLADNAESRRLSTHPLSMIV